MKITVTEKVIVSTLVYSDILLFTSEPAQELSTKGSITAPVKVIAIVPPENTIFQIPDPTKGIINITPAKVYNSIHNITLTEEHTISGVL
jgi:hypothetical protein